MGKILLIDDNEDFRELFKISLNNAGITGVILEAADPLKALEVFNKNQDKIEIVVCDFYMPVQNGMDFLEFVKSKDSSIFCCLLTGNEALTKKKFPNVEKCFYKENLADCIQFLKHINWRRD